jgi:GNAT superfamily N-acetyltransferase
MIRPVASTDLDLICHHRAAMFRDAGRAEALLAAMADPFRAWLEPRLVDGCYFGFIAERDGAAVGGIGLMVLDWPPHPLHPEQGRRGYVLNVYVEPGHRGQGVAKALMAAGEAEFAARGIDFLVLHATEQGRPLYAGMDWTAPGNEMVKSLA